MGAAGVPTALNVDGLEWERGKWGPLARKVFLAGARAAARNADALVYDSEALGEIWRERFGRDGHYIPYGAHVLEESSSVRLRRAGLPTGGYILAVARIVPENNVDTLLDALPLIRHATPVVIVEGILENSIFPRDDVVERLRELLRGHFVTLQAADHGPGTIGRRPGPGTVGPGTVGSIATAPPAPVPDPKTEQPDQPVYFGL